MGAPNSMTIFYGIVQAGFRSKWTYRKAEVRRSAPLNFCVFLLHYFSSFFFGLAKLNKTNTICWCVKGKTNCIEFRGGTTISWANIRERAKPDKHAYFQISESKISLWPYYLTDSAICTIIVFSSIMGGGCSNAGRIGE